VPFKALARRHMLRSDLRAALRRRVDILLLCYLLLPTAALHHTPSPSWVHSQQHGPQSS
jgi:hypothetical protein